MKEYLVDVPVLLDAFVRPHKLKEVFESIKKARPSTLFIVSDGPREGYPNDWEKIQQSRSIVEDIDWDCKVYKLYYEKNLGMYGRTHTKEFIFSKVDRFIRLEDDIVPHPDFFRLAAELLEKYKDDLRINMICGMNHLGVYDQQGADYFFTKAESIWGFATWKRSYDSKEKMNFNYNSSSYLTKLIKMRAKDYNRFKEELINYPIDDNYGGHPPGSEFWFRYNVMAQNQLNIVVSKNMINCIGYGSDSTHSAELKRLTRSKQKLYNMKTHGLDFPIKHPACIVEDKIYEKKVNNIMRPKNIFIRSLRFIENVLRYLLY